MIFSPIALASLGAGLDAALTDTGIPNKFANIEPPLLVCCVRVVTSSADLRLYRRDDELGRWVPSAVAVQTVDVGVYELRFNTAKIAGHYALVQEGGTGVVAYVFREGSNG